MPRDKRAPTQIEKYGFKDMDLTTPGHDSICMWLEDNILDVLTRVTQKYPKLTEDQIHDLRVQYRLAFADVQSRFSSKKIDSARSMLLEQEMVATLQELEIPPISKIKVEWEPVLKNDKSFEVGFLDMRASFELPFVTFRVMNDDTLTPIITTKEETVWFEAKTRIPSLGELFRQLSFYRGYVKDPIVVVSNDTRYKNRIEQQGYQFIEPILEEKQEIQPATLFPTMRK